MRCVDLCALNTKHLRSHIPDWISLTMKCLPLAERETGSSLNNGPPHRLLCLPICVCVSIFHVRVLQAYKRVRRPNLKRGRVRANCDDLMYVMDGKFERAYRLIKKIFSFCWMIYKHTTQEFGINLCFSALRPVDHQVIMRWKWLMENEEAV